MDGLEAVLGLFGSGLGVVLGHRGGLGGSWGALGAFLAVLGMILGDLGAGLGSSWGALGRFLGPSWAILAALGASLGDLGLSWGDLCAVSCCFGTRLDAKNVDLSFVFIYVSENSCF